MTSCGAGPETIIFMPLHIMAVKINNAPGISLMGKTQEGKKADYVVTGFLPYFYLRNQPPFVPSQIEKLHPSIKRVSVVEKTNIYGYSSKKISLLKIEHTQTQKPSVVQEEVKKYAEREGASDILFFETNIGYVTQFMIEREIVGMGYVEISSKDIYRNNSSHEYIEYKNVHPRNDIKRLPPLKILSMDIECVGREGKFPAAKLDPVVQIGNILAEYPSFTPKKSVLFCMKKTDAITGTEILTYQKERDMLNDWSEWVKKIDPDIITGYNITGFDIPYLLERAVMLNLKKFDSFSRTGENVSMRTNVSTTASFGTKETKVVVIPGRIVFDVFSIVKKEFNLHSYSLNTVSSLFLQEEKEDVHYTEISSLFNGTAETRRRLGIYCMKDVYLPLKILFTKNLLINYCELARVTGVPFEYLVNRGQGIRVLSQLLRRAKESEYVLPEIHGEEEKYEGGYVMEPEKGFYTDPVIVLDFASLYPSIIMAYNLCYTTLLDKEEIKTLDRDSYILSPTGDCFAKTSVRAGILPDILESLLNRRKEAKKELKQETDPELRMSLDARQLALKISANSVYGFTGAAKTGLPCIPISRSVTSFGREILKMTRTLIENQYNKMNGTDIKVVYGDTDSVLVMSPGITMERAFELGESISSFCTKKLTSPLMLEFEKVYSPFLLLNKKKYAGCIYSGPSKREKIETKGIETVRRDNCALVRELMQTCLNKIFIHKDIEGTKSAVKECVENLSKGNIGISRLVITKSISKKEEKYSAHLAHVELAEKMRKRDPGTAPGVGDRVSYVIVCGKGPLYQRAEDPVYVLEHSVPIDIEYYLENQIKKPVTRLLEYVVKDVDSLLVMPKGNGGKNNIQVAANTGLGVFLRKKEKCLICRCNSFPVCSHCESKYADVMFQTLSQLSLLQYQYYLLMSECQRMQHSTHTPIVCCNRDCSIFYTRKELTKKIQEVQGRYDKLFLFKK